MGEVAEGFEYRGTRLEGVFDRAGIEAVSSDYRAMVVTILECLLDRAERRRELPFIDTKLNVHDGRDFPDDDPIRGPGTIYAWIQGRGLEALAGHARWLPRCPELTVPRRLALETRIESLLRRMIDGLERLRERNHGRLQFMLTATGQPLRMTSAGLEPFEPDPAGPANLSELFYAKGLAAAADHLADAPLLATARELFERVTADIEARRFVSDQQPLDPRNVAAQAVPGRFSHGPYMLLLSGAGVFLEATGDRAWGERGLAALDHVLRHHIQTGEDGPGRRYDMWEYVDTDGRPFIADGRLLSDPGHTNELVGFALKFLRVCESNGFAADRLAPARELLPRVLRQSFANGFRKRGIIKSYDLLLREDVYDEMPWWSLPETIRAAVEARAIASDEDRPHFGHLAAVCSNAFLGGYVRPSVHLMAVQALRPDGTPSTAIPATPDLDPGYHTGLCLIDAMDRLAQRRR